MKFALITITFLTSCISMLGQEDPVDIFYADIERAEAKYRVSHSKALLQANRVVLHLVDFDGISAAGVFANEEDTILIAPYNKRAKILASKEVDTAHQKKLLNVLSKQIAKLNHTGGAFCHFPIHGIRIYNDDALLYEGTFCWMCGNFSYNYPEGSGWLDTTAELKKVFNSLLPIPQKELDRFYEKYPAAKPKGEQNAAEQPATAPQSKSK